MKTIKHPIMLAAALIATNQHGEAAGEADDFTITRFTVTGNQAVMVWSGGRAGYQVQACPALTAGWTNVGNTTSNTTATVPVNGPAAFFRVVSDFTARYQVVFDATWSQATHPTNWPANAHWSGPVGGVHNGAVHFFRLGETSSEGIRKMAELGQQATLLAEVAAAQTNGTAHFQLAGLGLGASPGSRLLVFPQAMNRDYPLVTLCSMIAPSPDWFVGVDSLSLVENGQWVSNKVVTLYGNDAGTDSGASYTSPDLVTVPRGVATQFTGFPSIQNGVIVPFGTFTFTRLD